MTPNPNIYGASENWHLANYDMPETYLPAWGIEALNYGKLSEGVTENKIKLKEVLDQSISYVGMGIESPYSNIITINSSGNVIIDNRMVTNFFYAYGSPVTYDYYIPNDGSAITWNVDALANDNYNKEYRPIVSFNPKKLLWHVMVTVSDAKYNGVLYTTGLNTYSASAALQSQYPYLKMAFMYPLVDTSSTDTPHWINTLTEPMHLCINEQRSVEGFDFITFNDLKITSAYYRSGILLRGSIEGIGNTFISDTHCVYMLGDETCIEDSGSHNYVYAELYNISVEEEILKAAACFCNYFVGTNPWPAEWESTALNSDTVFLGYPDSDGVSHGDYTIGADNEHNPIWTWTQTKDSNYDYSKIDTNVYNDKTGFATQFSPVVSFNRMYATDENNIIMCAKALATAISLKPSSITAQEYSIASFLTNNPLDAIISIKKYPFAQLPATGDPVNIQFGAYNTNNVKGIPMSNTVDSLDFVFSTANKNALFPVFDNTFLDYEPFTHAELIIPYCGTVPICCADYMGHTIKVKMVVDYITGACTAYIMRDNVALQSISGQIGIDVPVSGIQKATLDSQIVNANLQYKAAQLSGTALAAGTMVTTGAALASAATGNMPAAAATAGAAVTGVAKIQQQEITEQLLEYNAKHVQVPFKQLSSSTGVISEVYESRCRLVIYRPVLSPDYNAEKYAKTIGFACLKNGLVKDFTGITYGDINTDGIPCTDAEKTMIRNAFATGVIL